MAIEVMNAPVGVDSAATMPVEVSGTPKAAAKRQATPKIKFPIPEGGLKEVPEEYKLNKSKYQPLREEDFSDPIAYHEMKAEEFEKRAKNHRRTIVTMQKFGTDKSQLKKVADAQKKLAALQNASAMLASLGLLDESNAKALDDLVSKLNG